MITKNDIASLNLSPTKKDFVQIWNELIEVASKITERWDPTSTNESDPGIVLLKALAGIADKLNYNIDKNILEAYMPTAAQMESMRKLCEMVGYDIKYYQSAETTARISYTGNTTDRDSDEYLPDTGLAVPKFTTLTNADKDITFVTTNTAPMLITNLVPWVEVPCIEGQISQCESTNENNLITLAQLDDNNRYYLPEIQIAENGIFVYNALATSTGYVDGTAWDQVSNLNTKATELRVFKFGYDSFEGRPYLAFPDDVGSLIGDGLFIYFVRTSGLNGNISPRTLEVLEVPTGKDWENYSAELFEVVNYDATTNGANIESISAAYNNFKKTVGTFDTLVTCRDYMNKIYSLMDASNSPYVSNILVTDIRNDINSAVTLCSCNEFGILYKETPLTDERLGPSSIEAVETAEKSNVYKLVIKQEPYEVPLIDHFDLRLYPFKTFTQVSSGTTDLVKPYRQSFTYTEQMNREIEASLADYKTCAHNLTTPAYGDIVTINNYLRLDALIATSIKVSEIEAKAILNNVKVALVNEFNLRNLDFGEEIPFESILSVIENADSRIKVVSLQEPTVLTTYSVKEKVGEVASSKEYGIASSEKAKIRGVNYTSKEQTTDANGNVVEEVREYKTARGETAKDIYNKLVLRNILAGRASLLDYDETFISNNSEKPYTITKNITQDVNDLIAAAEEKTEIDLTNDEKAAKAIEAAMGAYNLPGEYVLVGSDGKPLKGFDDGIVSLKVFGAVPADTPAELEEPEAQTLRMTKVAASAAHELQKRVYETFTPANIRNTVEDITRVEAVCELTSTSNEFKNVTLAKNEVIKFRAPNLITTKTFPAYVYYRFERDGVNTSHADGSSGSSDGSYAAAVPLISFIRSIGVSDFFNGLWSSVDAKGALYTRTAKKPGSDPDFDQRDELPNIFNTAIAVKVSPKVNNKEIYTYSDLSDFNTDLTAYFEGNPTDTVTISYYPLTNGTLDIWSEYVRECFIKNNSGKALPDGTTLWRLSTTSDHAKGKLVTESGQRLYAQGGDFLNNVNVGTTTYICIDHGSDPVFRSIAADSDVELRAGDRLYIHYTPSSTNEDGETTNAEPISIVYNGGDSDNPVILKPSGFDLVPSDDLNKQGTSWKKTDVDFGGEKKNLLALAPNEQIEMRSISRVILNKPARFYRNFDAKELDGNINGVEKYELKDGEYIFYTDQNTQEAAYYGSGSVITLDQGAFIPKATETVEVSQILEKGLHVVPWSNYVLLSDSRKITITEYRYTTLVEGDKLNALTIEDGSSIGGGEWKKCDGTKPIKYTTAGAETTTELPKIALSSGPSTTWEVCSFLELSTSPGYAQQLRAVKPEDENIDNESNVTVTNKLKVYQLTSTGEEYAFEIVPQTTVIPASDITGADTTRSEPISIKLDTIAQVASGNFEKNDGNLDDEIDDTKMRLKLFKEDAPALVELDSDTDVPTPISNKYSVPVEPSSENLNNYWTKLDIKSKLLSESTAASTTALNLNLMIPENTDLFGIFSIYLEAPEGTLDPESAQHMPKGPDKTADGKGCRVFIDIPVEYGPDENGESAISIFNYAELVTDKETNNDTAYHWWSEGIDKNNPNRFYLRAGLNCIKVNKSCSILIKAEAEADGSILYDALRLVKGRTTNGVNLALLDPNATFNALAKHVADEENPSEELIKQFEATKQTLANQVLEKIAELDRNHDFYYNVSVENSLAIEFDNNIDSFSNPYTLYDINNVNNSFVVSKLDVAYLDEGLKIAKSSRY